MQCSYCQCEVTPATGVTLFLKNGTAQHFCSRRCERYFEMKRNPRRLKWTGRFEKGKAETKKKK